MSTPPVGSDECTIAALIGPSWLTRRALEEVCAIEVGHEAVSLRGRAIAALLSVPDSVLSHRTGAAVHHVRRDDLSIVHLTAPGRSSSPGIKVHLPDELPRAIREARVLHGLDPTTLRCPPGRRGARTVKRALRTDETEPTRSQTERRVLNLISSTHGDRDTFESATRVAVRDRPLRFVAQLAMRLGRRSQNVRTGT